VSGRHREREDVWVWRRSLPQPSETAEAVKKTYIDANQQRVKFANMIIIEITGSMLRTARSLAGLSQQEIAERARISRPSLTTWENSSSSSVPSANTRALGRVVSVLENEGVVFIAGGATLPPLPPITAQSEARP